MIREVSIELRYFWQRQPRYPNTQSNPLNKIKKKNHSLNQANTRLILIILSSSKNWQLL